MNRALVARLRAAAAGRGLDRRWCCVAAGGRPRRRGRATGSGCCCRSSRRGWRRPGWSRPASRSTGSSAGSPTTGSPRRTRCWPRRRRGSVRARSRRRCPGWRRSSPRAPARSAPWCGWSSTTGWSRRAAFPADGLPAAVADNLAVLLARPDTDHVVPVLDGTELRAALAIEKPDAPITPADQRLMQDVADGAGAAAAQRAAGRRAARAGAPGRRAGRAAARVAAAADPRPGGGAAAADRRAVARDDGAARRAARRARRRRGRPATTGPGARTARWTRWGGPASRWTSCWTGSG